MNVRDRSGDVGPAAREAMGESCVSCMWLTGWVVAISAKRVISCVQPCTLLVTYSSVKVLDPRAAPKCRFPSMEIFTSVSVNNCLAVSSCSGFTTKWVFEPFG